MSEDKALNNNLNLLEALLLVILVAVIGAVYAYVVHERDSSNILSSSTAASVSPPPGTTASIQHVTSQDGANQANIEDSHDGAYTQAVTSSNSAVAKLGNAYNETDY